jgi:hypothetical protein
MSPSGLPRLVRLKSIAFAPYAQIVAMPKLTDENGEGDGHRAMGLPLAVGAVDPNLSLGPSQRHFLTSAQLESASLPNACSPDIFWTIRYSRLGA